MKWTEKQRQAIDIPVSDIIVSAAAGSGKTAVMAERIIKRLTGDNRVDIDKILVVTYTNAAASEIRERVMKKIVEKLSEKNDESLQRQLILLNNSHFCTIHSFCLELIKKYFYRLGIDPNVKTGDTTELDLLLHNAFSDVTDLYFSSDDSKFKDLYSLYANNKEHILEGIVLDVFNFSRTMPNPDLWLSSLCEAYSNSESAQKYLAECVAISLHYAENEYEKGIQLINTSGECEKWLPLFEKELSMVQNAIKNAHSYNSLYQAVNEIEFVRLPVAKAEDVKIKEKIKSCRDSVKDIVSGVSEKMLCISPDMAKRDNGVISGYVTKLTELVGAVSKRYAEIKRENNLIDFSDYEHMALALLRNTDGSPTDIALSVSEGFEEIYIDEYQDCNNIQNVIFSLISGAVRGKPNVFCVGDMKQSIYKFRDANPLNFREKCDKSTEFNGTDVHSENKIFLNSNFRSRLSVLNFVNSVFTQLMSEKCGELVYDDSEKLIYGEGYTDINADIPFVDIDLISESDDFGAGDELYENEALSRTDAEVCHIAKKIKNYVNTGYKLFNKKENTEHEASYRDIVILLRSPRAYTSSFEKIFPKFGIPVYCDNSSGYFETEEVEFILSLLKIIDNPNDDIALVSVMKKSMFGFDENMLLKIRMNGGYGSFYECLTLYRKNNDDEISVKIGEFTEKLENYHEKSRFMSTDEFIDYIVTDTDYLMYLSTFSDSKMRTENVRFLIQKARDFEKNNYRGIFSFVNYIENIKSTDNVEGAKIIGADENVVRVMSIHKSKGLEFPIVFVAGLGKKYNMSDANSSYVIHKGLGIGLDCINKEKVYKVPSINKLAIKQKIKFEAISEELRVLYVALTRATEKLVLTGCVKNGASLLNNLENAMSNQPLEINPHLVAGSKCFMELILMAAMRSHGFESASGMVFAHNLSDGVSYNLSAINISSLALPAHTKSERQSWQSAYVSPTGNYDKVSSVLDYVYPYSEITSVSGNVTVTEIKRMHSEDDETLLFEELNLQKPRNFSSDSAISGPVMGTLVHLCMEKLDFSLIKTAEDVRHQLDTLLETAVISQEEYNCIDPEAIYSFFVSDIGKRVLTHINTLKKEFSFKYLVPVSDVYPVESDEKLIVQGTVDAYFEDDNGELVVIDYKTDRVKNNSMDIANRYRIQLKCYCSALSAFTGKKVKEAGIYLFDTGEYIVVQ